MRRTDQDTVTERDEEKIQILAERFFLAEKQTDLTDIEDGTLSERILDIFSTVTTETLRTIIQKLSNNKTSDSDNLLNEILKNLRDVIMKNLAEVISK